VLVSLDAFAERQEDNIRGHRQIWTVITLLLAEQVRREVENGNNQYRTKSSVSDFLFFHVYSIFPGVLTASENKRNTLLPFFYEKSKSIFITLLYDKSNKDPMKILRREKIILHYIA